MAGTEIANATANRNYALPYRTNDLNFDVARVAAALNSIDIDVANALLALAGKAPLADPHFTGEPTAPTPNQGDGSNKLATTAYVDAAVGGADLSGFAKLDSPNLIGSPTAPTPTEGAADSRIAPTAYVDRAIATLKGEAPLDLDTLAEIASQVLLRQKISDVNNNAGFKNEITNGDFDFWQRFTSTGSWVSPVLNFYTADRWAAQSNGSGGQGAISRQAFPAGQTDVPGDPAWFLRWQITSAAFGQAVGSCYIEQRMENVRRLAGKKVTVTFYVKGTGTLNAINLIQVFGSGGSALVTIPLQTGIALTSSWQKIQKVVDVPSIAGKTLGNSHYTALNIQPPINSTFTLDIAHVSVTRGDTSKQDDCFPTIDYTMEGLRCQRYYEEITAYWIGDAVGGQAYGVNVPFKVRKRATPVIGAKVASGVSNGGMGSRSVAIVDTLSTTITALAASSGPSRGFLDIYSVDAEL